MVIWPEIGFISPGLLELPLRSWVVLQDAVSGSPEWIPPSIANLTAYLLHTVLLNPGLYSRPVLARMQSAFEARLGLIHHRLLSHVMLRLA